MSPGRKINTVFPSQAKEGEAMNTNSPTDCWCGFSNLLVYASSFFHLVTQAIEVEEHFHVQHAYATLSDLSYFKRNKIKWFLGK